jgi:Carboxypeptidase regulatory-like domain
MRPARLLALLALCSAPATAQRYAGLYGRVLDTSDGGIGMASVTAVDQDTGFRRTVESQPGGSYSIGSLFPGTYKMTVRKEGFVSVVRFDVPLRAAEATRADFILPVGSVEESITVYGTAPLVEHENASTSTSEGRDEIDRFPLNGRGLLTLVELAPGAIVTPATRGEAGQFTATGQRPNTNYFTVDGVSANTGVTAGGLPAQSTGGVLPSLSAFGSMDSLISLDAVEDFRITTSTSIAEFGRLPGATVSLTSRSGSNEFHGATSYRIRNELFSANDWFGNQSGYGRLPLRLQDVTQTIGGPIRRNRVFFFLSYEHGVLGQPGVWRQPVPSADARASVAWAEPVLDLFPLPAGASSAGGIGEAAGRIDRPAGLQAGSVRVDQALTSRVTLFGRYNDSPSENQFGTLGVNRLDLRSRSLTLGLNARPTASLALDLRANESQSEASSLWTEGDGCALQPLAVNFLSAPVPCDYLVRFSIGGIGQLVSGREGDRRQRQFQLIPAATWRHGSHAIGLGADYRRITAVRRDPTGSLGVIADTLASLTDQRSLWISKASAQNASTTLDELSLWVADTWQATRRLTIAAGLRWEFSPAPLPDDAVYFYSPASNTVVSLRQPLWPDDYRSFAPRLGAAWRLTRDGRTVLRAGGGVYFDSALSIATDILNGGPLSVSQFTSSIHAPFSTLLSFGFMPGLKVPRVVEWNVSVERALGADSSITAGYVGSTGRRLMRREVGGSGSSATSLVALTTNDGSSNYAALEVQYQRRLTRGFQATASYAWSHSLDNDSSDAYLLWAGGGVSDRGSSDFDLRHNFTAAASYEPDFLRGWGLDLVFHARSGFPITPLAAEQYQGISYINAFRPNLVWSQPLWIADANTPGGRRLNPAAFAAAASGVQGTLGRNVLTGFGMSQVDLAVRREFRLHDQMRLQFRLEAFNAFNHPNFADPVRYLTSPLFGESPSMMNMMLGTGSPGSGLSPMLQTGGPRSLQGSVRFVF